MNTLQNKYYMLIVLIVIIFSYDAKAIMPNGGKDGIYWVKGDIVPISWDSAFYNSTTKLKIELWNAKLQTKYIIADSIYNNTNVYFYTIHDSIPVGDKYKVIVSILNIPASAVASKTFFEVYAENYFGKINKTYEKVEAKNTIFSLSPNPTKNTFKVEFKEYDNYTVTITSQTGIQLLKENVSGFRKEFELSNIESGVYFVNVESNTTKKSITEKLVIAR